jgi:thiol peroxidase
VYSWLNAERVGISLSSFLADGVPVLLSVFASFDTPISRLQAKVFDNRLRAFGEKALGVQITSDLPSTINRAFRNEELVSTVGASDYFDRNFGRAYGVLLEDSAVLTRAVFVIDAAGILRYAEVPEEVTWEPNYDAALSILETLVHEALRGFPGYSAVGPRAAADWVECRNGHRSIAFCPLLGLDDSWRVESVGPVGIAARLDDIALRRRQRPTIAAMRGATYGRLPSTKCAPLIMNPLPVTLAGMC